MYDVGKNIRFYRTLSNMSMEDLGEKVGVQKQTIQKYETGKIVNIPRQKIDKIAKALSVEPAALTNEDAFSVFNEMKKKTAVKSQQAYKSAHKKSRRAKDLRPSRHHLQKSYRRHSGASDNNSGFRVQVLTKKV